MSCQDEVLRIGKKLEKMISSKNVVSSTTQVTTDDEERM